MHGKGEGSFMLCVCVAEKANLYQSGDFKGCYADQLLHGMTATILDSFHHCYYVATYYGYKGFVQKADVRVIAQGEYPIFEKQMLVTASFCPVTKSASVTSRVVMFLCRGGYVTWLGEKGGWYKVLLASGGVGYVQKRHLTRAEKLSGLTGEYLQKSICDHARSYLHTSYLMGGKTPKGIDCSGLCSQVYLNHQITIYRDAVLKEGFGVEKIERGELRPGDLLYFPKHMALYLGCDNYIHASGSYGGVTINSLAENSPLYRDDLDSSLLFCGRVDV